MDDAYDSGSSHALSPQSQKVHHLRKEVQKLSLQVERQKRNKESEKSVRSRLSRSERRNDKVRKARREDRWKESSDDESESISYSEFIRTARRGRRESYTRL